MSSLIPLFIMINPHKLMLPVRSSRFFLTIFLVVLVVAVFRIPALEGENDSDIVVTFSDSSDKETVLPRGLDSIVDGVMSTVEPSSKTVTVSTTFDIEIWLRNVQQPIDGFVVNIKIGPPEFIELIEAVGDIFTDPITHDVRISTIRLHCLSVGSVTVDIDESQSAVKIGTEFFPVAAVDGVIQQTTVIGGIIIPTNKLVILTPYIALAGLIVAASAVFIIKRRKD